MSPSFARKLTFWGLLMGLVGVLILFRYGMPFHVPTHGHNYIYDSYTNNPDITLEHRYTRWGYVGLGCLVVGTILQMLALWSPRSEPVPPVHEPVPTQTSDNRGSTEYVGEPHGNANDR